MCTCSTRLRLPSGLHVDASVIFVLPQRLDALPVLLGIICLVQCNVHISVLTSATFGASPCDSIMPTHGGAWGLNRSARSERPQQYVRCIDAAQGAMSHQWLIAWRDHPPEAEQAVRKGTLLWTRMLTARHTASSQVTFSEACTHVLTGGTGGLGMIAPRYLAT